MAFVFAGDAAQQTLLEQGRAQVSVRVGDKAWADSLLNVERAVRTAGRGFWTDPNFAPLSAENLTQLRAMQEHFALFEDKVLSVRESGATIYVNFGRRWTRDFTVIIVTRALGAFDAAEPKKLEGHRFGQVAGVCNAATRSL